MIRKYTHEELNMEVQSIAGYYMVEKEESIDYKGRKVLYTVVSGAIDNSCCGVGGWRYASVQGHVVGWKNKADEAGRSMTEVETIVEEDSKREIAGILKDKETVAQVEFW